MMNIDYCYYSAAAAGQTAQYVPSFPGLQQWYISGAGKGKRHDLKELEKNLCRVYTKTIWRPGTKPDVCENGFPSFKTQISCLQL